MLQSDFFLECETMTKNPTERLIETVSYLDNLFDFCNAKFFNGELVKPVITAQRDEKNKTNGWFSTKPVWFDGDNDKDGAHEINLTAQQLNRNIFDIAETMLHECCHLYAHMHDIQDSSRAGTYHNKLYAKIAKDHGLNVEQVKTYGWSQTSLTEASKAIIAEFVNDNPANIIYRSPCFASVKGRSSSTRKYECPICGTSVRATKEVRLICADCQQIMQEVE